MLCTRKSGLNGLSLERVANRVEGRVIAFRIIISINEMSLQVKEANRDLVKTQVVQLKVLVLAKSTVKDTTVERLPVSKVILSHILVHILSSLSPSSPASAKGVETHKVKAVLLALSESHPLAACCIATSLTVLGALIGYEADVGGFHNVAGNFRHDHLGHRANCRLDDGAVVCDEEPAGTEELGNR